MRYFEAVADTLHFGRAARRLNITQPALSAQIAQMEAAFGLLLFERRPSGVVLTPDGAAIRSRIRRIMGEIRDLEAFGQQRDQLSGPLRLGLIASVAPYVLPRILGRIQARFPDVEPVLRESVTDRLLADLLAGDLDCAVVALPVSDPALHLIDLVEDPFFLAVPACEAERIAAPVRPQALRSERLILLEEGHCLRDQALSVCQIVEARDLSTLGATSLGTLLRMVSGGLGVTLAPRLALATESRDAGIAFLPFQEPCPMRRLALAYRASSGRQAGFAALCAELSAVLSAEQALGDRAVRGGALVPQP